MGSEVGRRRVFILVAGGNPALPLAAPRKHARVPGPTCARSRSLTGPASALLAGKSLKTLMSKGILQVHPPICDCPGCRISSPVVRCGRKPGASGSCFSAAELGLCFLESVLTSTLPVGRREPSGANRGDGFGGYAGASDPVPLDSGQGPAYPEASLWEPGSCFS